MVPSVVVVVEWARDAAVLVLIIMTAIKIIPFHLLFFIILANNYTTSSRFVALARLVVKLTVPLFTKVVSVWPGIWMAGSINLVKMPVPFMAGNMAVEQHFLLHIPVAGLTMMMMMAMILFLLAAAAAGPPRTRTTSSPLDLS